LIFDAADFAGGLGVEYSISPSKSPSKRRSASGTGDALTTGVGVETASFFAIVGSLAGRDSARVEQPAEIPAIASNINPKICPFLLALIKFIIMPFIFP
jgi:hypothetical protein